MPNYTSRGQSALDLRTPAQIPDNGIDTPRGGDAFPGETFIGIALGSPRDSPLPPLHPEDTEKHNLPKRKVSRWKSFGNLFGKKGTARSDSGSACYYSQHPPYREMTARFPFQDRNVEASSVAHCYASRGEPRQGSLRPTQANSPTRRSTVGNKSLRRKMSFKRNNSQRKGIQGASRPNRNRSHTAPLPRRQEDSPRLQSNGESLLQVEIPSVEMERYSVMFSDLLQPPTNSSLLARRQAHLEELYTGAPARETEDTAHQDLERPNLERRTPSRSSTRSSTFSLFPTTQNTSNRNPARKISLDRSPLSRSMTAPGAMSPGRAKKERSDSQEQNHVIVIVHSPARASSIRPSKGSRRGNSYTGASHRSQSSTEASFVEAPESPIEVSRSPLKKEDLPLRKSSMKAPQKPPDTTDAASRPMKAAQTQNITATNPDGPDLPLRDAAEISVARQISVSRRQRHLLVPIVPKTARQPVQPTVVDVREFSPCRKSHHLVLESS